MSFHKPRKRIELHGINEEAFPIPPRRELVRHFLDNIPLGYLLLDKITIHKSPHFFFTSDMTAVRVTGTLLYVGKRRAKSTLLKHRMRVLFEERGRNLLSTSLLTNL